MSFQTTAARSSRIKKTRRPSAAVSLGLRRSTSSQTAGSPRRKPAPSERTESFDEDAKLDDLGVISSLAGDLQFRDVPQYMQYIRSHMFSEIPDKAAGMNSTRIAEVLNFRKMLPPVVTIAHVDALSVSSTQTEREIAELAQAGVLRRVMIPQRGAGAAAVGDGIVSMEEWRNLVQAHPNLDSSLQTKYLSVMDANPRASTTTSTAFTSAEVAALTASGFLTTTVAPDTRSSLFAMPGIGSLASLSTAASRHAAGSAEAVGGSLASQHIPGGVAGQRQAAVTYYNFSLPNMGLHIRLLVDARTHLLSFLHKTKHKEAPLHILREKWDGGVLAKNDTAEKKRSRREFAGALPGRTKKWKQFYGLRFEWILEECVGAGLIELFETGSVGQAARVI